VVLDAVAALVGADLSDSASALSCPLLLMHPDSSPFIPVPVVDDLRRRVRDARLHVIGRARHGMPVSHAATCSTLLRGFLDETRE
jgi:pimeloyl-ACP methyl ester carboxylesterase